MPRLRLSRRAFLQAIWLACVAPRRPFVARLTALAEELAWLLHWCSRTGAPSFACAG